MAQLVRGLLRWHLRADGASALGWRVTPDPIEIELVPPAASPRGPRLPVDADEVDAELFALLVYPNLADRLDAAIERALAAGVPW